MPSKTGHQEIGQSDFFNIEVVFICSFLDSLFNQFSTKFWTTFGYLFGFLSGAFSGIWNTLGMPLDTKTLKNCEFFQGFWNKPFWIFEAPDNSFRNILPPLEPNWSQNGPQKDTQKCTKKIPKIIHVFFWLIFFKNVN